MPDQQAAEQEEVGSRLPLEEVAPDTQQVLPLEEVAPDTQQVLPLEEVAPDTQQVLAVEDNPQGQRLEWAAAVRLLRGAAVPSRAALAVGQTQAVALHRRVAGRSQAGARRRAGRGPAAVRRFQRGREQQEVDQNLVAPVRPAVWGQ